MNKKILIISGPTASGKSDLALNLANEIDAAIINADSLQIFKGLPILSSQPTQDQQIAIEHFLYSCLEPSEYSSVVRWLDLVKKTIEELWRRNKLPIIVGGTGMYISKLVEGISEVPEIDKSIKLKARSFYEEIGREDFLQKLIQFGEKIEDIEKLDRQRLIRLYEVFEQSGKSLFYWHKQPLKKIIPDTDFVHVSLNPDRQQLYQNCNLRFEKMLISGVLDEVNSLLEKKIEADYQINKTLGFSEICDFLSQKITKEKMLEIATQKTRNYAKRQLTWFRNQLPRKNIFTTQQEAFDFLLKKSESEVFK